MTNLIRMTTRPARGQDAARTPQALVLDEVGSALFASLPRSDQRRKGAEYVRGLLVTHGRKSIRNIATRTGGPAAEQSLHHFISDSTWEWDPVRLALARYLARTVPPQAWVVRPTIIPKAGEHSVGVRRHYFPAAGHVMNAQHAVGVWAASEELTAPVDWRLHLQGEWLDVPDRRSRAAIPDGWEAESFSDCTVAAFLATAARRRLPPRPVLLDAREIDASRAIRRLRCAGGPLVFRIRSTHRLSVADPALPGHGAAPALAHQIVGAAHRLRHPVTVAGAHGLPRTELAATVGVREPGWSRPLLLLGVGRPGRPWPAEMWLTDMADTPPAELVRLARLVDRVDHDFDRIAEHVGIRDYAGRSFTGWHRHMTLASVAHTVAALASTTGPRTGAWTA